MPIKDFSLYLKKTFRTKEGYSLPYRILPPPKLAVTQKYPLIVFLHGSGERGNDNQRQLKHGGDLFIQAKIRTSFPAYVIFPQCEKKDFWAQYRKDKKGGRKYHLEENPNPGLAATLDLIESLLAQKNNIDANRIYLIGLSMGAMGVLELLARQADQFASAVAICGGTNPSFVSRFANKTPLWLFHGDNDNAVPVDSSREIVSVYKKLNLPIRYTEYARVGHNSWHRAFQEEELFSWLFSHKKVVSSSE